MATFSNVIYTDPCGRYRIRTRGNRNLEINLTSTPNFWISAGTRDLQEAIRLAVSRLETAGTGASHGKTLTLAEFAKDFFLKTGKGSIRQRDKSFNREKSERHYALMQSMLNCYIIPRFGNYLLTEINDLEIEQWYTSVSLYKSRGEASDATKVKIFNAFKLVMESARKQGHITINPLDKVERINDMPLKEREPFTLDEIKLLFPNDRKELERIWGSLQWALFFSIMVDTGWRCGEVSALSKSNIVGKGVYSKVSVDACTRKIKQSIKTTKKGQDYKVGILSSYTLSLLADFFECWDEEYLFLFGESKVLNRPEISNKHLKSACIKAGVDIKGRSQHCFRHTFDTYMLNNISADLKTEDIRELLAHTTYRPEYDHRTPEQVVFRLQKVQPLINNMRA